MHCNFHFKLLKMCTEFAFPFICRLKGTIIHRIWLQVAFVALYTTGLVYVHNYVDGYRVNFPQTLIPVLGLVTSLLLVFRTNTAYDRYWEGRKLWSTITHNIRILTRIVWATVDENKIEDLIEKLSMINLLVAFPYAVKNHLRGIHSYEAEDLKDLLAPLPRLASGFKSPHQPGRAGGIVNAAFSDDEALTEIVGSGYTPAGAPVADNEPHDVERRVSSINIIKRKPESFKGSMRDKWRAHAESTEANIPVEILLYFTTFINKENTKEPNLSFCFVWPMNVCLLNLSDAVASLERILQTPIPLAYAVHLQHTLWLYLLALPYQLIGNLNWWTVPATAFTSFALLGILYIGLEIENPFGTDYNDLPLEQMCDRMKREAYLTVGRAMSPPEAWILTSINRPLLPTDGRSAVELSKKSLTEIYELLVQRAQNINKL